MQPILSSDSGSQIALGTMKNALAGLLTCAGACGLGVAMLAFVATGAFAIRVAKQQLPSAFLDEHSCAQAITEPETRSSQGGQAAVYWTELADTCLEDGLIAEAFECYENAIAADPVNSTAYHDLGNVLLLFRRRWPSTTIWMRNGCLIWCLTSMTRL